MYVRFEATIVNSRGVAPGIFALANELAHSRKLSDADFVWWRENNDWFDAAYANPGVVDSTLFDRSVHPRTVCWFKTSADHLLTRATGYLNLLDRYGVGWVERRTKDPGLILYEDEVQVVVAM